ncbi:hypothetical protein [Agromyces humi]|uniref:hypothetical protein n=1 Tax=Agromyces humi TaxID=1766800 RepID=UPI001358B77E|nr:hypothetical protein [Agromyces humi]
MSTLTSSQPISATAEAARETARRTDGQFGTQTRTAANIEIPTIRPLQSAFINESEENRQAAWEFVKIFPNGTAVDFEDALWDTFEDYDSYYRELADPDSQLVLRRDAFSVVHLEDGGIAIFEDAAVHHLLKD